MKVERRLLPSAFDVIHDTLAMHAKVIPSAGEIIKYLVCDFKDAFFMLPLWWKECLHCGTWYQGSWYIWQRIPQGSINGPSVYGRLSALTGRMSQGLQDTTVVRTQIYTDDPCTTLRGTEHHPDFCRFR